LYGGDADNGTIGAYAESLLAAPRGNNEGCRGEAGIMEFGEAARPTICWCWDAVIDSSCGESERKGLSDEDDRMLFLFSSIL
jgi:hypothetical protein